MKNHSKGFLKLVQDAKTRIRETNVDEVHNRIQKGDQFHLIDVREESEWNSAHLPGATHMSKGTIERDIERKIPDQNAEIVLYCGGGFRSALAADNLQKMGYTNIISMDGGFSGWKEAGYSLETSKNIK
jgi:rhodanese-related sulfurtransferase